MKKKKSRMIIIFLFIIGLILIMIFASYQIKLNKERLIKKKQEEERIKKENLSKAIKSHYNTYVKVNKEAKLYNTEYEEIGLIGKEVELTLKEINIDHNTKYFCSVDDYCISYKDVDKIDLLTKTVNNIQYKKYVPFNENVVTENKTIFYNDNGLVYQINESINLPIIIKDNDKYYVIYKDKLLYVKKSEIKEIVYSNNSSVAIRNDIRTLTYHVVYDPNKETCNSSICHTINQFDSHMKYLSENNYLTLTMNDLELFLDKKTQIPKKSIVVTLDDGQSYFNAVNIVEKHKVYATYFIVTSWYDVSKETSQYMNFQSHTNNMHNNWKCNGGSQGGELLCADKDKILTDIKTSVEKLGRDTFAFAYPFFDFNDRAISILKEAGIRLAFIGQYDTNGYSTQSTDKMLLRRKTIFSDTTLNTFISYLQ